MKRESSLHRNVTDTIIRHRLFAPGDTVVVAVSGGVDSMVLLDLLASLTAFRLRLVAVHLNHLLRGAESDLDEAFVRKAADRYDLPLVVRRLDVRAVAREQRLSLEEAGRETRQIFLEETVRDRGAVAAALGHHADDQAETVLMRLLRGAGTGGLRGIVPRSAGWKVRPLIEATRAEIVAYAAEQGVAYREDSSNTDRRFLRNRIRHELIPLLMTYNPAIARTLAATAGILSGDSELLIRMEEESFGRLARVTGEETWFSVAALGKEPEPLRLRLYRRAIGRFSGGLRAISSRHLHQIDDLLEDGGPSRTVTLPGALRAARCYDLLRFYQVGETIAPAVTLVDRYGTFPVSGGELLVFPAEPSYIPHDPATGQAVFDPDAAPFPWTVRSFQAGDRITLFGMSGRRRLKELFIDMKVPRHLRRRIPLLCDSNGNILWVCGLRRSDLAPVSRETCRAVTVEFLPDSTFRGCGSVREEILSGLLPD